MKLPDYMKTEFPISDGKIIARVYVEWWGWPIIYLRVLREVKGSWLEWLYLIYILPKIWIRAIKTHSGINVILNRTLCGG